MLMKTKGEFARRLRRIIKDQQLAKVDCYCQNWDGIELREALVTQFNEVIDDARRDFPPIHGLKRLLQRLDQVPANSERVRKAIRQTITAMQKWLPPEPSTA
jgi:hypothetical protein